MKLKPSSRIKRRYLLLKGSKEKAEKIILDYIGILGWAKAGCVFINVRNLETGKLILSADRKEVNNIRAAFEAADSDIVILKVSGTLKGLGVR